MSAIDVYVSIDKTKGRQGEDRVRITLCGKFLPHIEQSAEGLGPASAAKTKAKTPATAPSSSSSSSSGDGLVKRATRGRPSKKQQQGGGGSVGIISSLSTLAATEQQQQQPVAKRGRGRPRKEGKLPAAEALLV